MEWRVTQLRANISSGLVTEAHWTLTHEDAGFSAYAYGSVAVPTDPGPVVYAGLDEGVAIEAVKDILGPEQVTTLEESLVAQIALLQNPVEIVGVPWPV
jgi:hypothetical protein